jgi:biopolymer transport protein ExbB
VELLKAWLDPIMYITLGSMSFVMVWFAAERHLFFKQVKIDSYVRLDGLKMDLSKRLTTIATIGSNAPYVGLLGTVLGVLVTFYDIGQQGNISSSAVMLGLAMALKATALGLVVAIPSIVVYNGLLRRIEEIEDKWKAQQGL